MPTSSSMPAACRTLPWSSRPATRAICYGVRPSRSRCPAIPALIVPRTWTSPDFGRRAVVAWNGSEQSAAAVRKAMPLLQRAEQVTVLAGTSRGTFPATMRIAHLDVMGYLRHHGVTAELKANDAPDEGAGEAILKLAAGEGADLIVMGAFGHSRFREWILGGATRHVLEHMVVPVFMSHK